jgi:hypothetical protein
MTHTRPICGDCPDCRAATARLLRVPPGAVPCLGPTPTKTQLERHARRFGPDQVAETAAELGVDVEVERTTRRRVSRGPTLRQRVAGLVAAGHGAAIVAEMENLTPARARALVAEMKEKA